MADEAEAEASRLKTLSEQKYIAGDLGSALKLIKQVHRLSSAVDGVSDMLAAFNILRSAATNSTTTPDYYRILQLERFSHINLIKKQYRKLALTLHPDKNAFVGSEEAFKLVAEAFRVLSDKSRRKEYDSRLRIDMQSAVLGDEGDDLKTTKSMIWTECSSCGMKQRVEREYLGHNLVCTKCKESFEAVEVGENRVSARVRARRRNDSLRFWRNGRRKIRSVGEVLKSLGGRIGSVGEILKSSRREMSSECGGGGGGDEVEKEGNEGDGEEEMMTLAEMQMLVKKKVKKGKVVVEEDEENENENEKEDEDENEVRLSLLRERESEKRKEVDSSLIEEKDDDMEVEMLIARVREKRARREAPKRDGVLEVGCSESSEMQMGTSQTIQEQCVLEESETGTTKSPDNLGLEDEGRTRDLGTDKGEESSEDDLEVDTLIARVREKRMRREARKGDDMENGGKKGDLGTKTDKGSKQDDLKIMAVESFDPYNFDKDKAARSFKKGQVWAVYDDDGMPRDYALIDNVISMHPFVVRLHWLELQSNSDEALVQWGKSGFHISCGKFKVSGQGLIKSLKKFSHVVDCERAARELYRIYPTKGSIWALFKEDDASSYDIVISLSNYTDVHGMSIGYLEKVDKGRSVFKRREIGAQAVRLLKKDELRLFSHQIPARKLSDEEALNVSKQCWELDPASLPPGPLAINWKSSGVIE